MTIEMTMPSASGTATSGGICRRFMRACRRSGEASTGGGGELREQCGLADEILLDEVDCALAGERDHVHTLLDEPRAEQRVAQRGADRAPEARPQRRRHLGGHHEARPDD